MANSIPPPPPGFQVVQGGGVPPPPPGFELAQQPDMPSQTLPDTNVSPEQPNGLGSDFQNAAAGMGKAFVDQGRGIYQSGLALAKSALAPERAVSAALNRNDPINQGVQQAYDASKQAEAETRIRDAPLMNTKAGLAGNIAGYAVPLIAPAIGLRGTAVSRLTSPTSVPGLAAQGGLLGLSKPLATGEGETTRLSNAGLGALAGGAGAIVPRLVGATARGLGSLVSPFTRGGQESIAANAIRTMAENPSALSRIAPSNIPGVQRTLAEEALDPGIAQMQRQYEVQLASQQAQNNAARAGAIRSNFNGADAAGEQAAKDAAERVALPLLRKAQRSGAQVKTEPVISMADKLMAQSKGNPAAVSTIQTVKDQLANDGVPERGVAALYNTRKYIDDLLAGRAGGDSNGAKAASVQLRLIKAQLDRQIRQAAPEFGQYLAAYKAGIKPANQAAVGSALLDAGGAVENAVTGERPITPASFARATNDLDRTAAIATGFGKARAASILTPEQQNVIQSVRDDLSRLNYANTAGRGPGSPTASNLATQNVLNSVTRGLGGGKSVVALEPVQRLTGIMEKTYNLFGIPDRLHNTISAALADPVYARQIIGKLPASDRATVESAIGRITGPGASIVSEAHKK